MFTIYDHIKMQSPLLSVCKYIFVHLTIYYKALYIYELKVAYYKKHVYVSARNPQKQS